MFAGLSDARKEKPSSKDKKDKKKRKRQSDIEPVQTTIDHVPAIPGDGASVSPLTKSKPKKPRTDTTTTRLDIDLTSTTPNTTSSSSPFKLVTTRLYLPISPLYSPYPWLSLESDHLDPLILTYYLPLRGIILSYRNLRFNQCGAKIQGDSPFAFTWVTVDFLLWCPQRGDFLEGWVNLQSESHIGLLVLNTFNVSVPRGKIPAGWKWCEKREGFLPKKISSEAEKMEGIEGAELGDEAENGEQEEEEEDLGGWQNEKGEYVDGLLRFKVESVKASGHIIAIEGNLLEVEGDIGQGTSSSSTAGTVMNLAIRPARGEEEEEEQEEQEQDGVVEISLSSPPPEVGSDVDEGSPIKEKKKRKKDKEKKEKKDKEKKEKKQKKDKS